VPRHDLPNLLHQCDVLVLPSYFEGFPLVQLEALASGLPIIGTEATGAPDLITDGVEGYVTEVGDAEALRDKLSKFIASPSDLTNMSMAARHCAERYSWDAYGDRWTSILRQAA
jgi:starch synthase